MHISIWKLFRPYFYCFPISEHQLFFNNQVDISFCRCAFQNSYTEAVKSNSANSKLFDWHLPIVSLLGTTTVEDFEAILTGVFSKASNWSSRVAFERREISALPSSAAIYWKQNELMNLLLAIGVFLFLKRNIKRFSHLRRLDSLKIVFYIREQQNAKGIKNIL